MASVATTGRRTRSLATRTLDDRRQLRAFLEEDRLLAAYAICDLEDREFGKTRWGGAFDGDRLVALAVEYSGLTPQPLFVMGSAEGIEAILHDVVRPRAAYVAVLPESMTSGIKNIVLIVADGQWSGCGSDLLPAVPADAGGCPIDIGELNRLYQLGFASWLPSSAIVDGVYYGIRVNGRLVAAAGRVISRSARIAVVGNVLTHVDYRGRGYATAVTGAVTAELLRSCDQVVLNVRSDNPPALQAYRRLGYGEHIRFEERLAHRLGSPWPALTEPLRRFFTRREAGPR